MPECIIERLASLPIGNLMHCLLSTLALAGVVYAINGSVTDYAPLVNQPCPNVATDPLLRVFTQ
jgi:hypothetical protein